MTFRALLLSGALLVSPAWSQETAGFDLRSEAIRDIVRATAATQFRAVEIQAEKAAAPKSAATVRFVPPEKPERTERAAPAPPAPESNGFLSAMFETVIGTVIEHELDSWLGKPVQLWSRCQSGVPEAQQRVTAVCEVR
jgi:hypothetical protein